MFSLDERLDLCASFVRKGSKIVDIGTDHAYLPIWLVYNGVTDSAVASDVRKGPLDNAKNNIIRYGLDDKIRTVLSDGLDKINSEDADDIIMAGMGAELIVAFIDRTEWLFDGSKRLILQPMTRSNILRRYLYEKGFRILDEKACVSLGKSYSVICCEFDGITRKPTAEEEYIGKLGNNNDPITLRYISVVNKKLKYKIRGLEENSQQYCDLSELIKKLDGYTGE